MSKVLIVGVGLMMGLFLASASCKDVPVTDTNEPGAPVDGVVTLKFAAEGCDVLIEAKVDGKMQFFIPIDLQTMYQVEGMKISMTYHDSRAHQGSCLKGHPIIIDSIEKR